MGRGPCDKKGASLLWTVLECIFFSGVVLGWSWLALIFRADHYLLSGCNTTALGHAPFAKLRPLDATSPAPAVVYKQMVGRRRCKSKGQSAAALVGGASSSSSSSSRRGGVRVARQTIFIFNDTHGTLAPPIFNPASGAGTSVLANRSEGGGDVSEAEPVCPEQLETLRLVFALVAVLRDLLVLPVGAFFDNYGTTRTRVVTVLIFGVGTLMMIFTTNGVPWLILPALTLTGVAGVFVLLTNVQIANLFGRRRHTVMAVYCGASLSSGFITYMMQLSHDQGVDVQTSFMFLTIGLVPMLVSTVAFLPKTRVPWPLPSNYGRRRNQSLDENLLQAGVSKVRRQMPPFWPKGGHLLLVGAMLWHGVQSLHTAQAETILVDIGHRKDGLESDLEHVFGWIQLLSIPLSLLPGMLLDRHRPMELGVPRATQQMRNVVLPILITPLLAVGQRSLMLLGRHVTACLVAAFLLHATHRVFQLTTTLAFLLHVHFNPEHQGKYVGLTLAVSALVAAFQFPMRLYLQQQPWVSDLVMVTLMLLSLGHGLNVWSCCRRRLFTSHVDRANDVISVQGDNSCRDSEHALLTIHIQTDDSNLLPQQHDEGASGGPGGSHGNNADGNQGNGGGGGGGLDSRPGTSGEGQGQERGAPPQGGSTGQQGNGRGGGTQRGGADGESCQDGGQSPGSCQDGSRLQRGKQQSAANYLQVSPQNKSHRRSVSWNENLHQESCQDEDHLQRKRLNDQRNQNGTHSPDSLQTEKAPPRACQDDVPHKVNNQCLSHSQISPQKDNYRPLRNGHQTWNNLQENGHQSPNTDRECLVHNDSLQNQTNISGNNSQSLLDDVGTADHHNSGSNDHTQCSESATAYNDNRSGHGYQAGGHSAADSPQTGRSSAAHSPQTGRSSAAHSPQTGRSSAAHSPQTGRSSAAHSPQTGRSSAAHSPQTGRSSAAHSPQTGRSSAAHSPSRERDVSPGCREQAPGSGVSPGSRSPEGRRQAGRAADHAKARAEGRSHAKAKGRSSERRDSRLQEVKARNGLHAGVREADMGSDVYV